MDSHCFAPNCHKRTNSGIINNPRITEQRIYSAKKLLNGYFATQDGLALARQKTLNPHVGSQQGR